MLNYWQLSTSQPTTLNTEALAEATGESVNALLGMLGPDDEAATITVTIDEAPEQPFWSVPDSAALFLARSGYRSSLEIVGEQFPAQLERAWSHLSEEYETETAVKIMARYAPLFGYSVREETLTGYSQGDWHEVLCIEKDGETVDTETVAAWCYGDVFVIDVSVTSPIGADWSECFGGIYGNSELEWHVNDTLERAVTGIRADIRKELNR